MHRTTWLIIFACTFGLSHSASLPAGESSQLRNDAGKVMQAFCWSSHNTYSEPAMYFSEIFQIQVPTTADAWYARDMARVFEAYVTQKHGYVTPPPGSPTVFCSLNDSVAMAQGSKDLLIKQHQYYKQPVVETGWKMSAQQAVAAVGTSTARPAATAPAAPPSPSMSYGYCQCTYSEYIYYSAAFGTPADQYTHWGQAFLKFLREKHNFEGYIQCVRYESQSESQKDFDKMIRLARSAPPGRRVETGWVYTAATPVAEAPAAPPKPTAAAAPASAPAAAPAPTPAAPPAVKPAAAPAAVSTIHAVCWADADQATRYYSAIFSGAGSDYADWMPAFRLFLQQKYNYQQFVRCNKQVSQAEAQNYRAQMIANARAILLPGGARPKIIETGWTYP